MGYALRAYLRRRAETSFIYFSYRHGDGVASAAQATPAPTNPSSPRPPDAEHARAWLAGPPYFPLSKDTKIGLSQEVLAEF